MKVTMLISARSARLFAVDMGEIARISPRLVSLDLCPAIQVEFIVAPNNVLMACKDTAVRGTAAGNFCVAAGGTTPTFTVDRPCFYSKLLLAIVVKLRDGCKTENRGYRLPHPRIQTDTRIHTELGGKLQLFVKCQFG